VQSTQSRQTVRWSEPRERREPNPSGRRHEPQSRDSRSLTLETPRRPRPATVATPGIEQTASGQRSHPTHRRNPADRSGPLETGAGMGRGRPSSDSAHASGHAIAGESLGGETNPRKEQRTRKLQHTPGFDWTRRWSKTLKSAGDIRRAEVTDGEGATGAAREREDPLRPGAPSKTEYSVPRARTARNAPRERRSSGAPSDRSAAETPATRPP
jgi:hypothetical protein